MSATVDSRPVLYDPTRPDFGERRIAVYREMRDDHPVYIDPHGGFVALTRFEDVRAASLDWETFSSALKVEARHQKPSIAGMDPPRHSQLRAVLSRGFTTKRVQDLEEQVRVVARDLIGQFRGRGHCDLVAEFASLLPSTVFGALIGIPSELIPEMRELTDQVMRKTTPSGAMQATLQCYEMFEPLVELRRRSPANDLMTALLEAEADGRRLTEDEVLGFCFLLLVGGNDTTTNLIGNGIEILGRHAEQRDRLVADPSLLQGAIEEMLRVVSPTQSSARHTTRTIELHGVRIPADCRTLLVWGAANMDEREFDEPDQFDIGRNAPRHLALGYGAHFCLGAALARLELRVAFEELLAAMPEFEVNGDTPRVRSSWALGFEALPLAFKPTTES